MKCPHCNAIFDTAKTVLEADPDFLEFWAAYPPRDGRKQGRKQAVLAWHRTAPRRPPLADLLEALRQAKQSQQWQTERGRYIPLAASWLNADRWTDALILPGDGGTVSARELWRRIALLVDGLDVMYLRAWVEPSWEGPILCVRPRVEAARAALRNHWPELERLAKDYDITLKGER